MTTAIGLLCHQGVGGSARVAVGLAGALADRTHRVHLFARSAPFGAEPPRGVRLHAMRDQPMTTALDTRWAPQDLDALTDRICDAVEAHDLEILHFHYAVPFAQVAQDVRTRLGHRSPAVVGTLHGTDVSILGRRPVLQGAISDSLAGVDALTTVSLSHAVLAVELFELHRPPEVIPNFVDTTRFRPRRRFAGRRPRIAYVSNFRPVKQPEVMARIVDSVLDRLDGEAWLVGDGECMPAVEATLAARLARSQVRRLGVRLDIENVLSDVDVLLVTSQLESFCLIALEAMAAGVPVVAPRVGGLPELVQHERDGLLFEPGDEAQAAHLLTGLLRDPDRLSKMAVRARRRAEAFATQSIVARYEQFYRSVLARCAGRERAPAGVEPCVP